MNASIEELSSVLRYCPETGKIYWKDSYRTELSGREAGKIKKDGYLYVMYKRKCYLGHRLAWALHFLDWPETPLDHINMSKGDNRISNLRLATVAENNRNRPKQSNNKSGYKGVSLHKGTGKYHARLMANGVNKSLGYYATAEEAHAAYIEAAKEQHGQFANF